jgi:hypothetical protein
MMFNTRPQVEKAVRFFGVFSSSSVESTAQHEHMHLYAPSKQNKVSDHSPAVGALQATHGRRCPQAVGEIEQL